MTARACLLPALLAALFAAPALAQVDLPPRLVCTWVGLVEADGTFTGVASAAPTFTLDHDGQVGSWDPAAAWDGFPVMIAGSTDEALARHRADSRYGLVLIPNGYTPDGAIILDGRGLSSFGGGDIEARAMRMHCTPDGRPVS